MGTKLQDSAMLGPSLEGQDRSMELLGAYIYGLGMGSVSALPDEQLVGVGLITAADELYQRMGIEYRDSDERAANMVSMGIQQAWKARRLR